MLVSPPVLASVFPWMSHKPFRPHTSKMGPSSSPCASHPRAHITPSTLSPSCLRQNLRSTLDSSALVPHRPSPNLLMRHLNTLLLSPPLCSHCRSPSPGPQHPLLYRQNLLQVVPPPALPLSQHGRRPLQLRTLQWLLRGLPGTFRPL